MTDTSSSYIVKNFNNNDGYIHISQIPTNTPALIILPGELCTKPMAAISKLRYCEKILYETDTPQINIYSAYYDFANRLAANDRHQIFYNNGHRPDVLCETDIKKVGYVQSLFDTIFAQRISDKDGNKLDTNQLIQNFSNLMFFCHCHGASVLFLLQNMLESEMHKLKYTNSEIAKCESKIFAVMHAPEAPLEKFKFNTTSFISASDTYTKHYNHLQKYIFGNADKIQPLFLTYGKTFITQNFYNPMIKHHGFAEHNIFGMDNHHLCNTTIDGKQICTIERDILTNAIRLIQQNHPIPNIEKLVKTSEINFEKLKRNGDKFYKQMLFNLRYEQSLRHVGQR